MYIKVNLTLVELNMLTNDSLNRGHSYHIAFNDE